MPLYRYTNEETGEIKDILQRMTENHTYEENGVVWRRVWSCPGAAIDSSANADPFDATKFVDKTYQNKAKLGDIWKMSKEASEKRKDKLGYDPIKESYKKEYSEKRGGMKYIEGKGE